MGKAVTDPGEWPGGPGPHPLATARVQASHPLPKPLAKGAFQKSELAGPDILVMKEAFLRDFAENNLLCA